MQRPLRLIFFAAALALAACAGRGGPAATTGHGNGDAGAAAGLTLAPTALAAIDPCTSGAPGPRKLWRLTAAEFAASIHGIFNDTAGTAPVATVFSDPVTLGFSIDANTLLVQDLNAAQLEDNAEAIGAWAVANGMLSQFASCTDQTATCGASFIQGFGRRAFRATLAASDPRIAAYSALFMAGSSFTDGAAAVISAMLQSPYFLYRSELGVAAGNTFALTPYEVASELAYLLTGSTPDDSLLDAADAVVAGGSLSSMIDQQAQRLLTSGGVTNPTAVMGFMNGWLGLPRLYTTAKDDTVYMMTQALQDDMATESQDLIMEAFSGGGSIGNVLTPDHSFLNKDLADFYGIPSTTLDDSFVSVKYTGVTARDPGLLATGTILNGYARPDTDSPTQRGHLVRSRMLCQDIPPPPPGVNTAFTPPTGPETTRQQFQNDHSSVSPCYGCHKLMDWIGFAFESYDGFGRYRTTDNGLPIDNTATVYGDPQGNDVNVAGLSGTGSLAAYLAQSDDVRRCMMRYWSYYAYGSSAWAQDGCTYDAVYNAAQSGNFSLQSVLMGIIHAPNFTTRVQDQ